MLSNTKLTEKMNTALTESIQKFLIGNDDGPNLTGEKLSRIHIESCTEPKSQITNAWGGNDVI